MVFKFSCSLHTGIKELDEDHHHLVSRVNAVDEAERGGDVTTLLRELREFKAHLGEHFRSEEAQLIAANYPKFSAHAKHHAETMVALDRLIRDVETGEPIEGVAYICYHELVSVVLLRDMQFMNWLADRRVTTPR